MRVLRKTTMEVKAHTPATSESSMASVGMSTVDRSNAKKCTLFLFPATALPAAAAAVADVAAAAAAPADAPPLTPPADAEDGTVCAASAPARSSCIIAHASVATIAASSDWKCRMASGGTAENGVDGLDPETRKC